MSEFGNKVVVRQRKQESMYNNETIKKFKQNNKKKTQEI